MRAVKRLKRSLRKRLENPTDRWRAVPLQRDLVKSFHLLDALRETSALDGAIVECGVGAGASLAHFAYFNDRLEMGRKIWAFDSFEGFPEGTDKDSDGFDPRKMTVYHQFTVDWVRRFIAERTGQPSLADTVTYVEGFFPASFERYDNGPVAVLHLDVDLYQSYVDCLDFFWPLLQPGGWVLFDEYDQFNDLEKWPGAKRAIDEFAAAQGLAVEKHFSGFAYIRKPD